MNSVKGFFSDNPILFGIALVLFGAIFSWIEMAVYKFPLIGGIAILVGILKASAGLKGM